MYLIAALSGDQCYFKGCKKPATIIAYWNDGGYFMPCCDEHAGIVVEKNSPEYVETCPNCGCLFGVN